MGDAMTIVGAFFTVGIAAMLGSLFIFYIGRDKSYGMDEGRVVLAVITGIMAGLAVAGYTAGQVW